MKWKARNKKQPSLVPPGGHLELSGIDPSSQYSWLTLSWGGHRGQEHTALVSEGMYCLHTGVQACHQVRPPGSPTVHTFTPSETPEHNPQSRYCTVRPRLWPFQLGKPESPGGRLGVRSHALQLRTTAHSSEDWRRQPSTQQRLPSPRVRARVGVR